MPNSYICALDISSSKISGVIAEIKKKHIVSMYFDTMPSKGITRGDIVDSIDLIGSVSRILKSLKLKSGINIKHIYTNISGLGIVTKHSRAIIPLAQKGYKVITLADIQQVNEQARILGLGLDDEIIHQITHNYIIDSNNNILNPLGLYSHRLEVDLFLICGKLSFIENLNRTINQSGYEMEGLFFSGLAVSEVVFNKELQEGITILCDIGQDITELLVFKDGILKQIEVLKIGGDDLTVQLSEGLRITFALAEDIKLTCAYVGDYGQMHKDKEILVKKNNSYKPISQKSVSEILTPKAELMCKAIREATEKIAPGNKINNFVATGRAVLLEGFLEMLEISLGTPVKLGRIANPKIISWINKGDSLLGQKYLTYLTPLGIICQALSKSEPQILSNYQPASNPFFRAVNKFKEIYQEYF